MRQNENFLMKRVAAEHVEAEQHPYVAVGQFMFSCETPRLRAKQQGVPE